MNFEGAIFTAAAAIAMLGWIAKAVTTAAAAAAAAAAAGRSNSKMHREPSVRVRESRVRQESRD